LLLTPRPEQEATRRTLSRERTSTTVRLTVVLSSYGHIDECAVGIQDETVVSTSNGHDELIRSLGRKHNGSRV
jgi:hypothetical protein